MTINKKRKQKCDRFHHLSFLSGVVRKTDVDCFMAIRYGLLTLTERSLTVPLKFGLSDKIFIDFDI